ncbi:uncharacterized protein LOC110731269 [Chenopodium quinoa]|uniref:uncharacterized protein LOC110731269 n=1 Tax=Chenopodium quinoa TaxID=63459 RepID=UPI000B79294C|nr:uncharacterized protein LOC110731269 [Chenopodium quinoa]
MKKLYRKGQVHPSPSPSPPPSSDQFSLSYLPAAILTLAATLSPQDKEVLAYLLSCSSSSSFSTPFDFDPSKSSAKKQSNFNNNNITNNSNLQQHPPYSSCYCFTCYTSYWARWDSSPNRQLIHEIIDAFEDNLVAQRKKKKQGSTRKEKRKNSKSNFDHNNNNQVSDKIKVNDDVTRNGSDGSGGVGPELGRVEEQGGEDEGDDEKMVGDEMKQGSVRKIVSFIGERIWGSVWG